MLEATREGRLGAGARAARERRGGGAGDAAVRVAEGDGERLDRPITRREPEEQRGAAADHRARIGEGGRQAVGGAVGADRREGLEGRHADRRTRIGELAVGEIGGEGLLEARERAEERGLHLGLGLAGERRREERRRGAGAERLEGADRPEPLARVGRGEVVHRALVERAVGAGGEEIPEAHAVGARDPEPPLGVEPAAELGDARRAVLALLLDGGRAVPEPRRDGGGAERAERLDLGPQLGDEPGEVGLVLVRRRRARRARRALEAGPLDEPAEEPLPLGLEEPDPVLGLGGAAVGVGARAPLSRERLLELDLAAPGHRRLAARALRGGHGGAELGLELGDPALEEDDLLEGAPEEALRIVDVPRAALPAVHTRPARPPPRGDPD